MLQDLSGIYVKITLSGYRWDTLAFNATHNHFVLDRGGKVFNRSAPVIKLPEGATEDDHLALIGLLNSSTACFWMKQMFHNKGSTVDARGARHTTDPFENFYEFAGTGLKQFPVTDEKPLDLGRELDRLAQEMAACLPAALLAEEEAHHEGTKSTKEAQSKKSSCPSCLRGENKAATEIRACLDQARERAASIRRRMIALQEELDWRCYRLYGITEDELTYLPSPSGRGVGGEGTKWHGVIPQYLLANARDLRKSQTDAEALVWMLVRNRRLGGFKFRRQHPVPPYVLDIYCHEKQLAVELDGGQHAEQRSRDERRTRELEAKGIRVLRFWNNQVLAETEGVLEVLWSALHEGDGVESPHPNPSPGGRGALPEINLGERAFEILMARKMAAGELSTTWFDRHRSKPITEIPARWPEDYRRLVERRIAMIEEDRNVGLIERPEYKRRWNQEPWEVQEQRALRGWLVDRLETPAYWPDLEFQTTRRLADRAGRDADFLNTTFWRLRGALDVPKERFVSYPHCSKAADPSLVVAWAGWDHLQQAQALAAYDLNMKEQEGWAPERLTPLLAGLLELIPWVRQWHNDPDPNFSGARMGDYFESFINEEARELRIPLGSIKILAPADKGRGRRGRAA